MAVSHVSPSEFVRALISAKRGDQIIYFEGDLAFARYEESMRKERALARFANAVYQAYKDGHCLLVQKKIKLNTYQYLAVKL